MTIVNKITFVFVYGVIFFTVASTVRVFDISQIHHIAAVGIAAFMVVTVLWWIFFHGGAGEVSGFFWKHNSLIIPIVVIITIIVVGILLYQISEVGNELVACLDQFVSH